MECQGLLRLKKDVCDSFSKKFLRNLRKLSPLLEPRGIGLHEKVQELLVVGIGASVKSANEPVLDHGNVKACAGPLHILQSLINARDGVNVTIGLKTRKIAQLKKVKARAHSLNCREDLFRSQGCLELHHLVVVVVKLLLGDAITREQGLLELSSRDLI